MVEPHVAALPAVEGLRFRTYRGQEDLDDLVDIANAASRADGATSVWTREVLRLEIEGATNADPHEDVLIAMIDDRPVAYARRVVRYERRRTALLERRPGASRMAPARGRPRAARPQRGAAPGRGRKP